MAKYTHGLLWLGKAVSWVINTGAVVLAAHYARITYLADHPEPTPPGSIFADPSVSSGNGLASSYAAAIFFGVFSAALLTFNVLNFRRRPIKNHPEDLGAKTTQGASVATDIHGGGVIIQGGAGHSGGHGGSVHLNAGNGGLGGPGGPLIISGGNAINLSTGSPPWNWPLYALVIHVQPDILDAEYQDTWDETEMRIRDKLVTGGIRSWGRPLRGGTLGVGPMEEILADYWKAAKFTWNFLDQSSGNAPHSRRERLDRGIEYTDVRVNEAQARTIWP